MGPRSVSQKHARHEQNVYEYWPQPVSRYRYSMDADLGADENPLSLFSDYLLSYVCGRAHRFLHDAIHHAHLVRQLRFDDPFPGYDYNMVFSRCLAWLVAKTKDLQSLIDTKQG